MVKLWTVYIITFNGEGTTHGVNSIQLLLFSMLVFIWIIVVLHNNSVVCIM